MTKLVRQGLTLDQAKQLGYWDMRVYMEQAGFEEQMEQLREEGRVLASQMFAKPDERDKAHENLRRRMSEAHALYYAPLRRKKK